MPTTAIPRPRPLEPAPTLRWGVIGPGGISERFAAALGRHGSQRIVAVGSRSLERAQAFAERHGVGTAVGSAEELVGLDEVDAVYVATPHPTHRELAELALRAGKHVLVEKPIAMDRAEAEAMTSLGRELGLLVMEAMWTRYLPQADVLAQLLDDGAVGEVTHVSADFGFVIGFDPRSRLFDPALGGGALLDAGVYPVSFITSVLGLPDSVQTAGTLAETGVDDHAQLTLAYDGGALAAATTSLRSALPTRAVVSGTAGRITLEPAYIRPSALTLSTKGMWGPDDDATTWTDDALDEPYDAMHYQADAFARYVADGLLESPVHDHARTVGVIGVLEDARKALGAR
ncbi:Gfo/Idh/MocA family protein [Amnibacterium endophyticum]|uniref:Gfo/Idh/MocA family protein n=1 Tax=Amnibacterium endophyticum TaxID=2109337 RepID=A0ABW4LED5_9MICO